METKHRNLPKQKLAVSPGKLAVSPPKLAVSIVGGNLEDNFVSRIVQKYSPVDTKHNTELPKGHLHTTPRGPCMLSIPLEW